jgi:hypothetical protein
MPDGSRGNVDAFDRPQTIASWRFRETYENQSISFALLVVIAAPAVERSQSLCEADPRKRAWGLSSLRRVRQSASKEADLL